MKVLYAIQGTGNGHLSRARDIIPELLRQGVKLDILVSGTQADICLPYAVKYRFGGMSFIFGKQGGVDLWATYRRANTLRFQSEVVRLPVLDYDLVLSDFEPVSAWACRLRGKPCIGLSHQAAVLAPGAPRPERKDPVGQLILKRYAPTTKQYGFHFQAYAPGIYTPVIRQGIRQAGVSDRGHYTVYLPAYSDARIIGVLSQVPGVRWEVFSKHSSHAYAIDRISVRPIADAAFLQSIASSRGVLSAAGFETPSESLYLGKKLCVVPMKNQYEQQCNAAALRQMGVPVLEALNEAAVTPLKEWVESPTRTGVTFPDVAGPLIAHILEEQAALYT